MQQYWLVKSSQDDRVWLYICTADGRETAKQMASRTLLGDPDDYIVTPLSNPGESTSLRINLQATSV